MKKVIYSLLFLLVTLSFQSCLHDEKDIFSENASERIEKAVTVDKQMLESSSNGWILHYYPGESYSGGGYVYLIKFKNGKVTVASEITGSDSTFTSDYAMIKDQGPVLSFDTYNPIIHVFGEATADNINSDEGDYEFIVSKATTDSIVMTGKKWGNKMIMTRMPATTKWPVYIDSIGAMVDSVECNFKYMKGKDSIANVVIDPDTRIAKITTSTGSTSLSFTPTTKGILFAKPLSVDNTSVQDLIWNGTDEKFTSISTSNVSLVFSPPKGFRKITDIAGTYDLYYYNNTKKYTFTLTPNAKRNGLVAHSGTFPYDFTIAYSKAWGTLSITTQDLGSYGSYDNVKLCPWSLVSGGNFTWSLGIGMNLEEVSGKNFYYKFVDNGVWSYAIDSFIFVGYINGSRSGYLARLAYVTYLIKTN